MSETPDNILDMYRHPAIIQSNIIADMEARITGGKPIVSANNVVTFLMEMASAMSSELTQGFLTEIDGLHKKRAQTPAQLYQHMSDYDYIGLFAVPSSVDIELILSKRQIIDDAVDVNANYKKVIIPQGSEFKIDKYNFSLYYPIEIKINKYTGTMLVSYDTTRTHPLHKLTQNTLEHRILDVHGLEVISIKIPLWQFKRETIIETLTPSTGFSKTYDFDTKFYAVRVFTNNLTDRPEEYVEISQTISDNIYDPATPTAKVVVDTALSKVKISIPQVYFTENKMGTRLKIALLTSEGAVDADITNLPQEAISATFTLTGNPEEDRYIKALEKPGTLFIRPLSTKIIGGSDGITFEELRQRVITNSFHGSVLLTPTDLANFFSDDGFRVTRYRDGITNRIYLAHKELTDSAQAISAATNAPTTLTLATLQELNTVFNNGDETYTILPTTIYKFDNGYCVPVTNDEAATLNALSKDELVYTLNTNNYTISPFHIVLDTSSRYPIAYAFDFGAPTVNTIEFIAENLNTASQLTIFDAQISHPVVGVGGFTLDLEVARTADLKDVAITDLVIVATTTTATGRTIYQTAEFVTEAADRLLFQLKLDTNYRISPERAIEISSFRDLSGIGGHMLELTSDITILMYVRETAIQYAPTSVTTIGGEISDLYGDFIPLAEQRVNVTFGTWLTENFTNTNIWSSGEVVSMYDQNVAFTHNQDVFISDSNGHIVYSLDDDNVILPSEHLEGDTLCRTTETVVTEANLSEYLGAFVEGTGVVLTADNYTEYQDTNGITKLVMTFDTYTYRENIALTEDNIDDYVGALIYESEIVLTEDNAEDYYNTIQTLRIPILEQVVGAPVLDINGNPVLEQAREIQYTIDMTHINKRLLHATSVDHADYYAEVKHQLRTYYAIVGNAKPNLIEETDIYFRPLRSMGSAEFKVSRNSTIPLELELTMHFKLYVLPHVVDDKKLLGIIEETVVRIIDAQLKERAISITIIAEEIRRQLDQLVTFVDVLGVNDRADLQTLIAIEEDVIPNLKQELVVGDDGVVSIERALRIEYGVLEE